MKAASHLHEDYEDYMNFAGSGLMLAMLQPAEFGLDNIPSLNQGMNANVRSAATATLTHISSGRQVSGKGINNRRCNMVEAFLCHFGKGSLEADLIQTALVLYGCNSF